MPSREKTNVYTWEGQLHLDRLVGSCKQRIQEADEREVDLSERETKTLAAFQKLTESKSLLEGREQTLCKREELHENDVERLRVEKERSRQEVAEQEKQIAASKEALREKELELEKAAQCLKSQEAAITDRLGVLEQAIIFLAEQTEEFNALRTKGARGKACAGKAVKQSNSLGEQLPGSPGAQPARRVGDEAAAHPCKPPQPSAGPSDAAGTVKQSAQSALLTKQLGRAALQADAVGLEASVPSNREDTVAVDHTDSGRSAKVKERQACGLSSADDHQDASEHRHSSTKQQGGRAASKRCMSRVWQEAGHTSGSCVDQSSAGAPPEVKGETAADTCSKDETAKTAFSDGTDRGRSKRQKSKLKTVEQAKGTEATAAQEQPGRVQQEAQSRETPPLAAGCAPFEKEDGAKCDGEARDIAGSSQGQGREGQNPVRAGLVAGSSAEAANTSPSGPTRELPVQQAREASRHGNSVKRPSPTSRDCLPEGASSRSKGAFPSACNQNSFDLQAAHHRPVESKSAPLCAPRPAMNGFCRAGPAHLVRPGVRPPIPPPAPPRIPPPVPPRIPPPAPPPGSPERPVTRSTIKAARGRSGGRQARGRGRGSGREMKGDGVGDIGAAVEALKAVYAPTMEVSHEEPVDSPSSQ